MSLKFRGDRGVLRGRQIAQPGLEIDRRGTVAVPITLVCCPLAALEMVRSKYDVVVRHVEHGPVIGGTWRRTKLQNWAQGAVDYWH